MGRRDTLLLGAGCFLAGVGATAVAAYVALAAEEAVERHRFSIDVSDNKAQRALKVAREGEIHVRALLRAPRVSESDQETDRREAQAWLRRRDPGQR